MIVRIHGLLEAITNGRAQITLDGGLTYELLLPAYAAARLANSVGSTVTLHTIHFLEVSAQNANMHPRLAAFLTVEDRAFFELFTTVKGIGPRKALKALSLETAQIAAAIADRDLKLLQSLPEIGKRMAETVVATLHGKVDRFVSESAYPGRSAAGEAPAPGRSAAREALEVLLQLGENRTQSVTWIDEVLRKKPDADDPQIIITEVLRLKTRA
jgi:holliday junction DNA helicase RuvA